MHSWTCSTGSASNRCTLGSAWSIEARTRRRHPLHRRRRNLSLGPSSLRRSSCRGRSPRRSFPNHAQRTRHPREPSKHLGLLRRRQSPRRPGHLPRRRPLRRRQRKAPTPQAPLKRRSTLRASQRGAIPAIGERASVCARSANHQRSEPLPLENFATGGPAR